MQNSTKKWLTVAGCLAVCAVLTAVIASSFKRDAVPDDPLPSSSSRQSDITLNPDSGSAPDAGTPEVSAPESSVSVNGLEQSTVSPETSNGASDSTDTGNGADSTGTEQSIQPDPVEPETPDEEVLTDPSQTPDGTPVEGSPEPEDHDTYEPPTPPSTNTGGGLPGFDNVPNAGENQGEIVDSDGDINKQVGIMD